MSSEHHPCSIQPPNPTVEHHHLSPSSYTTGNNQHLPGFTTLPLPQTPSPAKTPTKSVESNTTPESRIAAAIGCAIFNIRSNSLQDVLAAATDGAATNSPLIRTLSDANSSVNQDPSLTTTTPPKIPINNNPLHRTLSDSITTNYQQQQQQMIRTNKPIRRTILDATEYQEYNKTAPENSTGKLSPHSKRLKKLEKMVMEIEQRCLEITSEDDIPNPDPNPTQVNKEDKDESIGVERLKNGDVKFELDCSCGKRFEMLIKHNGYCFYKVA